MNKNKQVEKSPLRTSTLVFEEDGRGSSAKIEADALFSGVLMLLHHPHIKILTAIFQLRCQRKRYVTHLSPNLYISPVCFTSTISFPLCAYHVCSNNLHVGCGHMDSTRIMFCDYPVISQNSCEEIHHFTFSFHENCSACQLPQVQMSLFSCNVREGKRVGHKSEVLKEGLVASTEQERRVQPSQEPYNQTTEYK